MSIKAFAECPGPAAQASFILSHLMAWTMGSEECTELQIECTSECTELCIHLSVVQIKEMNHFVNAEDVNTHILGKCHVITAGGTTKSNKGPAILIMWQYALTGIGEFIHSLLQMEGTSLH